LHAAGLVCSGMVHFFATVHVGIEISDMDETATTSLGHREHALVHQGANSLVGRSASPSCIEISEPDLFAGVAVLLIQGLFDQLFNGGWRLLGTWVDVVLHISYWQNSLGSWKISAPGRRILRRACANERASLVAADMKTR